MTSVLRVFAVTLFLLQTSLPQASIGGLVMKHATAIQQPLQNARLELTPMIEGSTSRIARTDAGGRFEFDNLPPGRYRLSATRDGFIRQDYSKPIVLSRDTRIDDITFQLDAAPTVAGWIQDEFGEAIPNVLIEALRRTYDVRGNRTFTSVASAVTDDRGEYRIFWVDPGDYFFFATSRVPESSDGPPTHSVVPTYFPGVTDPSDARPLRVNIGREIEGVNFQLRRAGLTAVNGYLSNAVTGRPVAATITLARPAEDPSRARYQAHSQTTGSMPGAFGLSEPVPPGPYIVTAKSASGEELSGYDRIVIRAVTFPSPYDVRLRLSPPLTINGRIVVDADAPPDLRAARVSLIPGDEARPSPRSISPRADGQFSLNGVSPGNYVLDVSGLPGDLYIKAARYGSTDVLEKLVSIDVKQSAQSLQIILGSGGGRLDVQVFDPSNRPHAETHIVLVPDQARRDRRDQYRTARTDEKGHASIRGIAPGSYKLFAWESIEPNAHLNSDYIRGFEDQGVPVRVTSGQNTPVSIQLIPAEF